MLHPIRNAYVVADPIRNAYVVAVVLLAILALAVHLMGCRTEPACADAPAETSFRTACTNAGAPDGYCGCAWQRLATRNTCASLNAGRVPVNELKDVCETCAELTGGSCG